VVTVGSRSILGEPGYCISIVSTLLKSLSYCRRYGLVYAVVDEPKSRLSEIAGTYRSRLPTLAVIGQRSIETGALYTWYD
jgi:hypothetical protein